MIKKLQLKLQARILLYYSNAANDYQIASEIDSYLQNETLPHDREIRSDTFINLSQSTVNPTETLIAIRYCLVYWNGLYDYFYAQLLQRLLTKNRKNEVQVFIKNKYFLNSQNFYNRLSSPLNSLVSPIIKLIFGIYSDSQQLGLSNDQLTKGVLIVQKVNIENNRKLVKLVESNQFKSNPKLKILHSFSSDRVYLNEIIKTLESASRWDEIFAKIVTLRFRTDINN